MHTVGSSPAEEEIGLKAVRRSAQETQLWKQKPVTLPGQGIPAPCFYRTNEHSPASQGCMRRRRSWVNSLPFMARATLVQETERQERDTSPRYLQSRLSRKEDRRRVLGLL